MGENIKTILLELKEHAPFTALGAFTGVILLLIVSWLGLLAASDTAFHVFHPLHILLSAFVTAAMFRKYGGKLWAAVLVGFVGAVGICSLSDIIFPYLGAALLGIKIGLHICFIEHFYLVVPAAFIGILFGCVKPTTKHPHAAHVLISTWASLFYLLAFGVAGWISLLPLVFLLLFISVWLPCCFSDIIFPLLFVRPKG